MSASFEAYVVVSADQVEPATKVAESLGWSVTHATQDPIFGSGRFLYLRALGHDLKHTASDLDDMVRALRNSVVFVMHTRVSIVLDETVHINPQNVRRT